MLKQQKATVFFQRTRVTLASSFPTSSKLAKMAAENEHVNTSQIKQNRETRPPSVYFPLGYKEAAYQWWTSVTPSMVERKVLSFIPTLREAADSAANPNASSTPDPFGTRVWRRTLVPLSGKNRALNEVCVEKIGEKTDETLVVVHGYGAGLGFFYKNLEPISRMPGLKLYALDMLGMGNSSRPAFRIHAKDKEKQVIEAEDWFVDALEEWRQKRKIERFTLLGHSLGGYLAVSYALKYPGHLKKLILASPVGIPEDPYAVNASMPDPDESTLENEFTQDQKQVTENGHDTAQAAKAAAAAAASPKADSAQPAAPKRPIPSWLVWLWDANVSPFSIIRMTGPLGPRFVSGWTSRRFNHLPGPEAQALHDYAFSIFKQKGSGEYALAYILAPGAYARRPVINRIQDVGRQPLPRTSSSNALAKKETGFPIVFMYGENDWMDVAGGLASEEKLKRAQADALAGATDEERRAENGSVKVVIVPKAGHHLYLDNAAFFNDALQKEMDDVVATSKKNNDY
ncbi:alpha/beta hydrolase, putative [Cordyceps militaris CM01]|uniref:Alpha/beta hydrolase, putative n=1 Tax=Cordyceps militaris (strain CM01) TaxID=983644 RepID=G3JD01_CORMM|nr:alpha/beta hydrolase, putative [Cordyceps militaris CM01]EGX93327.1 alpha/beta hydrolase, putative [Cordyceps militaris CM01]